MLRRPGLHPKLKARARSALNSLVLVNRSHHPGKSELHAAFGSVFWEDPDQASGPSRDVVDSVVREFKAATPTAACGMHIQHKFVEANADDKW